MILLACDLDSTLIGDKASIRELIEKLNKLRSIDKLKLVYATGRSLESYNSIFEPEELLVPDGLICSVGTEIYTGPNYTPLVEWQDTFKNGWNRNKILNLCLGYASIKLQPDIAQNPYRIAFTSDNSQTSNLEKLGAELSKEFPNVELAVSHNSKFIDVTPRESDKGDALKFLAARWGINDESIICAGDSSNDIPLLRAAKAIVVGNALKELKDNLSVSSKVYYADSSFAAGIEEGLVHYLGKNWSKL